MDLNSGNIPAPTSAPPTMFSAAAGLRWFETADRKPDLLDELGKPLVCFHPAKGLFLACYLPERSWYWTADEPAIEPQRWSPPKQRYGRRRTAAL